MNMRPDPTQDVARNIEILRNDARLIELSHSWLERAVFSGYLYNFKWLGRPIIQLPQDICALQEVIWEVKPDLLIETGIAHGGTLSLFSSLMRLLDVRECIDQNQVYFPAKPKRKVIGIDIEIRHHNRKQIEVEPLLNNVILIEGDSKSDSVLNELRSIIDDFTTIMVVLDSNHSTQHVKAELDAYSKFVSLNSYIVVMDTYVEDLPEYVWGDRERNYGHGDNPKVACQDFLDQNIDFQANTLIDQKLLLTSSSGGFLKRVSKR